MLAVLNNETKQKGSRCHHCLSLIPTSFFFFSVFSGPHLQHTEVPRLGVESELLHWPTSQPQQHRIQATPVTYTTAHSNAGSLTHGARPGMEPASSWILVPLSHEGNSPDTLTASVPTCLTPSGQHLHLFAPGLSLCAWNQL